MPQVLDVAEIFVKHFPLNPDQLLINLIN